MGMHITNEMLYMTCVAICEKTSIFHMGYILELLLVACKIFTVGGCKCWFEW